MGINSLLLNLKSITTKRHISDYSGQSAGIDGYSWLHKALYSCGVAVGVHNNLYKFVRYFSKRLMTLLNHNIKPIVVFDGDKLPLKRHTEDSEYKARKKNYELAMEAYKLGQKEEANKLFMEAITVTPEMAHFVMEKLKETYGDKVTFIVAPYEADSQLAYLSKINLIQLVITEDSDLLVFGAKVVFYKMDRDFNGDEIKLENLHKVTEVDLSTFSHDLFIHLCILTGCDYLASPKGIGFKRAYGLLSIHRSIEAVIPLIKDKIPPDYYIGFLSAYLGFKYQRVFCPLKNKMTSLNKLDIYIISDKKSFDFYAAKKCFDFWGSFDFLGKSYDKSTARKIAYFEIDPITKESFISGYNTMYKCKVKEMAKIRSKGKKDAEKKKSSSLENLDKPLFVDDKVMVHQRIVTRPVGRVDSGLDGKSDDPLNKYRYQEVKNILKDEIGLVDMMKGLTIANNKIYANTDR